MNATRIDAVAVLAKDTIGNTVILTVTCRDYDHYKQLPQAVAFDGKTFGLTGWNSDRCIACYRSDAGIALAA